MDGHKTNGFANRIPNVSGVPALDFPTMCFYQPDLDDTLVAGTQGLLCWMGDDKGDKKALLLGDSFAGNYEPFWNLVGQKSGLHINAITTNYCVTSLTQDWTGPESFEAKDQCMLNRQFFTDNVERFDVVIFASNWMDYSTKNIMQGVLDAVAYAAARSKLVVIMAAPKAFDFNPVDVYSRNLLDKTEFDITRVPSERDAAQAAANLVLEDLAKQHDNVLYIDRHSMFNVDGVAADVTRENIPFSFDGYHISTYGSLSAAEAFLQSQQYKDFITALRTKERTQ